MKQFIVGTAGHVDHGKTALIKALTGMDPDRLKEEKERGITIDLGFASLLSPETHIGFIDVPGHERFIHNMLSGIGGVHYLLLVVAADESVMAQTREHLDICRLLGILRGGIVLTKADMVDSETLSLAREEVKELVAGSFLERAPVFTTSVKTGEGVAELREHLWIVSREFPPWKGPQAARVNVDRVFSMKGFGTVITGTLLSGSLARDQEVDLLPGCRTARIRNLQSYGQFLEEAEAGRRVAVNVSRLEVADLRRGLVLAEKGIFRETGRMDVHLTLLPNLSAPLRDHSRLHLYLGSDEVLARLSLFSLKQLEPGCTALARLQLERPSVAVWGDRFIVRRFSPLETLGGGVVLHPFPPKMPRGQKQPLTADIRFLEGEPAEKILLDLDWAGPCGKTQMELGQVFGYAPAFLTDCLQSLSNARKILWPIGSDGRAVVRRFLDEAKEKLLAVLTAFHRRNPMLAGIPREELFRQMPPAWPPETSGVALRELQENGKVTARDNLVGLSGVRVTYTEEEIRIRGALDSFYRARGLHLPRWEEARTEVKGEEERMKLLYRQLLKEGRLIRLTEEYTLHAEVLQQALEILRSGVKPGVPFGVPEFKDLLGLTRKIAIPLLEYLDRQRITRRSGDNRILNS